VLPQILAGILSVPLMYTLVKRYFGTIAAHSAIGEGTTMTVLLPPYHAPHGH